MRAFDLNLLRVFDAVMTCGTVTQAAEQLHMTAPAISQALSRLQEHIHESLFVRHGRGIAPTATALALHEQVQGALQELERGIELNSQFDPASSPRHFRIASHADIDARLVGPLQQIISEQAPHITIEWVNDKIMDDDRHHALRMRAVDLALTSVPFETRGFVDELLLKDEMVVVCRKAHPRIGKKIGYEQFFDEPHTIWSTRRHNTWLLNSLTDQNLPPRRVAYECDSMSTLLLLTSMNDWLCVTSRWHYHHFGQALNLRQFELPWPTRPFPVYLSWHSGRTQEPALQWLRSALIQAARNAMQTIEASHG